MKRLAFFTLLLVASSASYALPVGNPADASLLRDGLIWQGIEYIGCDPEDPCLKWCHGSYRMRIGFYGDYVLNRDTQVNDKEFYSHIESTKIATSALYLALNIWDRFDIFGTLGITDFCFDTNVSAFAVPGLSGQRVTIVTSSDFSWSIGARATIWEWGCAIFGFEAQYFATQPEVDRVTFANLASEYPTDIKLRYTEWQAGLGVAYRISRLVPYAAVKWAHANLELNDARTLATTTPLLLHDLEARKPIGYALGVSLLACEKASLTAEWRFADERAIYVNGQIRF